MNKLFYFFVVILLFTSYLKDKKKTKQALKKAWKSFENILPQFLSIIIFVGLILAVFDSDFISKILGKESGFIGLVISTIIGSITLIPGFVAFPTAALLLEGGAGYMQIAGFVSTLMMVGIVTIPVETLYFGRKATILRNSLAFIFSYFIAIIIGVMI